MKPDRLLIPFVLLAFVTMAQVHTGVSIHGLTTVALVPPLIGFVVVTAVLYAVYLRVRAKAEEESIPPQRLGFFLAVGVMGFVLSAAAGLMTKSVDKASPDQGLSPAFRGEGMRLSSSPLGMALTVPPGWTRSSGKEVDFALVEPGGAVLSGFAITPSPGASLDSNLREMLARRGAAGEVAWGEEALANERAKTVVFTEGKARTKIWLARRGPYLVGFSCSGGEAVFADAQGRCRTALDGLEAR